MNFGGVFTLDMKFHPSIWIFLLSSNPFRKSLSGTIIQHLESADSWHNPFWLLVIETGNERCQSPLPFSPEWPQVFKLSCPKGHHSINQLLQFNSQLLSGCWGQLKFRAWTSVVLHFKICMLLILYICVERSVQITLAWTKFTLLRDLLVCG